MAKAKRNGRPAQGKERINVTLMSDIREKGLRLADDRRLTFSVMLEQLILEEWDRKAKSGPRRQAPSAVRR